MKVSEMELEQIRKQHESFQELVQGCSLEELGQCAKLLAMYVTIYKQRYGDLPLDKLTDFTDATIVNRELSVIIREALDEASTMLEVVCDEQRQQNNNFHYYPQHQTIN